MKILGKKTSLRELKRFGFKAGRVADTFGRKAIHTIDRIAPIAATALAASGRPELAGVVMGSQLMAHGVDKAIRSGVNVVNPQGGMSRQQAYVNFGEDVNAAKRQAEVLRKM